ncbi:MAG: hypothetical protein RKP20_13710 [Candidatus Competibacter sp.]|nr:hypothetical protein [Candidatus Competibacter sp.]
MSIPNKPGKSLHQDWRTWIGVVLMLLAVLIYILTLDDALEPGVQPAAPIPAAAAPPAR